MSEKNTIARGSVNGITADRRAKLQNKLADAREVLAFSGPWVSNVVWEGGFVSTAGVRGHRIPFDEPADLVAEDSAPTPHEYLLSAVGACIAAGAVLHATVAGVQLTRLEVQVTGSFDNILRWSGHDDSGDPGFSALEVRARMAGAADPEVLRGIWNRALAGSPVANTVQRPTPILSSLDIVD